MRFCGAGGAGGGGEAEHPQTLREIYTVCEVCADDSVRRGDGEQLELQLI